MTDQQAILRDELKAVRQRLASCERAPLEHRVTDITEWAENRDRLRERERELEWSTEGMSGMVPALCDACQKRPGEIAGDDGDWLCSLCDAALELAERFGDA